ncbi:MAG: hypothetical protein RQ756_09630, partial [Flavobacteriaceae bacterium]|nr:hypothetical protein [Flavobacteriaceae bacterium]
AIANHPKHNLLLNALAKFKRFGLNLNANYINRSEDAIAAINGRVKADYFVMNASLNAFVYEEKLQVFLNVWNITDENFQEILGAQNPRRWVSGGIKWNLEL